ncbi:ergothioneine biosynthesis glutamate--cysteine ligase EgtA [Mycolicibacterium lutetiense]|jgi:glutamate--cysteine ligase|uniref:Glutamate--cysteine ligase EgtA n=1 Tax=Mycolicibacterium lutetiense TaxID=1641992 RepID=A0ABS5A1K1_9MYCO|nr:ergothioneine biosynthesis glutamate--cysteine ligase EgtA [Mycolicibacterium lutetiense]MBP2455645.1 glutamate--cysteine ligase [Mycolicibacterium lutetiense]
MAVPVRSDPARLPPGEFLNAEHAASCIEAHCLRDGPVGQVGLEIEAHCFDVDDPLRRPGWDELSEVIASVPALPGHSRITVEPGGAVELSGPPADGPSAAITALQADRAVLRAEFGRRGLGLVLLGADPVRPTQRINPGSRYQAMETFFAASGSAEAGAAMMTSTASVQVNLDAGPRADWAQRVRLAHALGPTMIAITANSPMLGGQFTGWKSSRQRVWSQLDSARCGPILGADGDDPASDWARYALRAPVMLVNLPDEGLAVPVTNWVPFADWADGRAVLGGRRPTEADLEYHLTTLFPPVRPRRWLEIRYLDSVQDALWPAVVFMLSTLLDDPEAAAIATEATAPVATAWDRAARIGLTDRRLQEAALVCVSAAAERAPAELTESMEQLMRSVQEGRCPADDFADQVVGHGIASAMGLLVKGEL